MLEGHLIAIREADSMLAAVDSRPILLGWLDLAAASLLSVPNIPRGWHNHTLRRWAFSLQPQDFPPCRRNPPSCNQLTGKEDLGPQQCAASPVQAPESGRIPERHSTGLDCEECGLSDRTHVSRLQFVPPPQSRHGEATPSDTGLPFTHPQLPFASAIG